MKSKYALNGIDLYTLNVQQGRYDSYRSWNQPPDMTVHLCRNSFSPAGWQDWLATHLETPVPTRIERLFQDGRMLYIGRSWEIAGAGETSRTVSVTGTV